MGVLGTLPQPARGQRDHEVVERVKRRADVRVVRITRNNRDSVVSQVYSTLRESLNLGPPGTGRPQVNKRKAAEMAKLAQEKQAAAKALEMERVRAAKKERAA